jgi:hypothetical protein
MRPFVAESAASISARRIDRLAGLVRGVKLVGTRSGNGRKYPPRVLAAAARLYAGVGVNLGHHLDPLGRPLPVPPEDRFGRILDPRPAADGGLVGDLRLNPRHPFADRFLWACEFDPGQYGFSPIHHVRWADGGKPDADGDLVAEAILQVLSVDLVSDGGTTSTVFESAGPPPRHPPGSLGAVLDRLADARPAPTPLQAWLARF